LAERSPFSGLVLDYARNSEQKPTEKLRRFPQFIFAHDALVQLVAIPESVFKLTVILGQSFDDDVHTSRGALGMRRLEKNNFSNLKFGCHETLALNNVSRLRTAILVS
jgi:hypothetical protein